MASLPALVFSQQDLTAGLDRRVADTLSVVAGLVQEETASPNRDEATIPVDLSGRTDAVARLHRMLAENPSAAALNLGAYLQDIATATVAALSNDRITRLQFACDPHCLVPPEQALSIGFVVVELVTNAVKFAHPTGVAGKIKVACTQGQDGIITVAVSDDGVGLPEGMDPMKADSLGLRIVLSLAAQLGARVGFEHDALGLSCVLQIPGKLRA